ncbi:MAG: imelysin family protein [Gammaproteobacteria bacterium]|nr:imelysin family protein [Gammaproteobacteria bacterium]
MIRTILITVLIMVTTFFANATLAAAAVTSKQVGHHYIQMAYQMFADTHKTAVILEQSINQFIANPNSQTHETAKKAWIKAHITYSQTEVFRFGNPNVDDWEGKVNAWPMDEGLLDYVNEDYHYEDGNPHANENLIASQAEINTELVKSTHEKAGSEANVASGYHAVEFLLWGQDQNAENASSGNRSHTDFLQSDLCTNPPCDRRAGYLGVITHLIVNDVAEMLEQWHPSTGSYAKEFAGLTGNEQVHRMLLGIGGLGFGELAAERIRVALIANSQEDEQSCFSDTTDLAILSNTVAIRNIYLGQYETLQGELIEGPSLSDLVSSSKLDNQLKEQLESSVSTANEISQVARHGEPFDQQILQNNHQGKLRLEKLIDQLRDQTQTIEMVMHLVKTNS